MNMTPDQLIALMQENEVTAAFLLQNISWLVGSVVGLVFAVLTMGWGLSSWLIKRQSKIWEAQEAALEAQKGALNEKIRSKQTELDSVKNIHAQHMKTVDITKQWTEDQLNHAKSESKRIIGELEDRLKQCQAKVGSGDQASDVFKLSISPSIDAAFERAYVANTTATGLDPDVDKRVTTGLLVVSSGADAQDDHENQKKDE